MKIINLLSVALLVCSTTTAQNTATTKGSFVFTTVHKNAITSIKNQNRSGTCWDYATVGFLESEILRKTGRTYDLSEMFVANKDYMDCAQQYVRMHGHGDFTEGGSADDVIDVVKRFGICPETAMAAPGSLVGDSLANFNEFFSILKPYIDGVATNKAKTITPQWKVGFQGILDGYLGKCPDTFVYEGKTYTPKSFAESLGLDLSEYVSLTSFTHHPFYEPFAIEALYKWRQKPSYNIPIDLLMSTLDDAIMAGYNVAWGGDVSEMGFTRTGLAIDYDEDKVEDLTGTDAARWLKMSGTVQDSIVTSLGAGSPERTATQETRQKRFDSWDASYDHVMLIYGIAKDQNGRKYYMVKNSWGKRGDYQGTWYMSYNYIKDNTIYLFLNKNAIDKNLRKKLFVQD
jgi:aminopeptidase C